MRLTSLTTRNDGITLSGDDREISGLTADSRNVKPGVLFAAIPGTQNDGRVFIKDALAKGASAVLVPAGTDQSDLPKNISVLTSTNVRAALSAIASLFYARQPETIAAVTGTSGKTSTALFTSSLWNNMGQRAASLGTLGLITPETAEYGSLTTPDAISLHEILDEVSGQNINHLAMEASSHGIELHRLDHVHLKAAAFTNLSRDHLDYHVTMENYLAAKLKLFTHILPADGVAVLNADAPEFVSVSAACVRRGQRIIGFGRKGYDIKLNHFEPQAHGQFIDFNLMGKSYKILLPVIGSFQVWNSLCALGLTIACGADPETAALALTQLSGVPGRLEFIGTSKSGGSVFVDYAHKPDALENVLQGLRPHVTAHKGAKLAVVFGCGGNRDAGKRPLMGGIAQRLADTVIVTDDNPRREDPATIRKAILAGCTTDPNLREIGDRATAIQTAVSELKSGDVLVIAGKGHEHGQIVGDQVLPFDDAAVARSALAAT